MLPLWGWWVAYCGILPDSVSASEASDKSLVFGHFTHTTTQQLAIGTVGREEQERGRICGLRFGGGLQASIALEV